MVEIFVFERKAPPRRASSLVKGGNETHGELDIIFIIPQRDGSLESSNSENRNVSLDQLKSRQTHVFELNQIRRWISFDIMEIYQLERV